MELSIIINIIIIIIIIVLILFLFNKANILQNKKFKKYLLF